MLSDPIIEELWQIKDAIAKEFNYDPNKYLDYLEEQGRKREIAKREAAEIAEDTVKPPDASDGA